MSKQEIEKALKMTKEMQIAKGCDLFDTLNYKTIICEALEHQLTAEPTASEFLRKAKAIYKTCKYDENLKCPTCPIKRICGEGILFINEADLVSKVMAYELKEDAK